MRSMRPLHGSESRAFLDLMCEAFRLERVADLTTHVADPHWARSTRWGLFEGSDLVSILSTAPLEFAWGRAIGIASVATRAEWRRRGLAEQLLHEVLSQAEQAGICGALLFAHQEDLYRRAGFELLDTVVSGVLTSTSGEGTAIARGDVRTIYDRWSFAHPARLRRTASDWVRWRSRWRDCVRSGRGYIALDNGQVREAVDALEPLPAPDGVKWYGLDSLSKQFGLAARSHELLLMGRGFRDTPQMFMTDQF